MRDKNFEVWKQIYEKFYKIPLKYNTESNKANKLNEDINNGCSEIDALYNFANRSATPEIKKFNFDEAFEKEVAKMLGEQK